MYEYEGIKLLHYLGDHCFLNSPMLYYLPPPNLLVLGVDVTVKNRTNLFLCRALQKKTVRGQHQSGSIYHRLF